MPQKVSSTRPSSRSWWKRARDRGNPIRSSYSHEEGTLNSQSTQTREGGRSASTESVTGGDSARNCCAAHTRDGGGNPFDLGLSAVSAGLTTSADLRRSLARSKRFPD